MQDKIEIDTRKGKLSAWLTSDPDYPGIVLLWEGQQIALIDCPSQATIVAWRINDGPANQFKLRVWDHNDQNDPTHTITITKWEEEDR